MKTPRSIVLLTAITLVFTLAVVFPATANHVTAIPPLQSGVTLTATGRMCDEAGEICFDWVFDFDPAGGPVNGSYAGSYTWVDGEETMTGYSSGSIEGYFEGGDGGAINGSFTGQSVINASGGGSQTLAVSGTWEGALSADGTGAGSMQADNTGYWSVNFDAAAFQAALATPALAPYVEPTQDEWVQVPESYVKVLHTWPELDPAIAEILNQDGAIIARDEQGVFYAIDNQGVSKPLPPEMQSVLVLNREFGILQSERILQASPAVQAALAAHGPAFLDAVQGSGNYEYYTVPEWLRQRQYLKTTVRCVNGVCSSYTTVSVLKSSLELTGRASSEHGSVRGTINGTGDFIYTPRPVGVKLAALDFQPSLPRQASVNPPYLGVQAESGVSSAYIKNVQVGSPADLAGMVSGDIITGVSGIPIDPQNTLASLISQHSGGKQVALDIIDNAGISRTVNVVLAQTGSPVVLTPSAEITVNNETVFVLDIGLNGVTGLLVLENWAHVREPVSGSEVDVPAGSAVVVVPGYAIGSPIPVTKADVNAWWGELPPTIPAKPGLPSLPSNTTLIGLVVAGVCLGGLALAVIAAAVVWTRRKRSKPSQG